MEVVGTEGDEVVAVVAVESVGLHTVPHIAFFILEKYPDMGRHELVAIRHLHHAFLCLHATRQKGDEHHRKEYRATGVLHNKIVNFRKGRAFLSH